MLSGLGQVVWAAAISKHNVAALAGYDCLVELFDVNITQPASAGAAAGAAGGAGGRAVGKGAEHDAPPFATIKFSNPPGFRGPPPFLWSVVAFSGDGFKLGAGCWNHYAYCFDVGQLWDRGAEVRA